MKTSRWTRAAGVVLLATALGGAGEARADWPSARHDAQRTGRAAGTAELAKPTPFWRFFHGGTLASAGALVVDVDGDGKTEAVLASGDGIAAKRPDTGDVVWSNGSIVFGTLDGLVDFDGDGTAELVAHTNARAYVLRLADGVTLWAEAPGEMGTLSALRIGDLTGDGRPEMVIHECGCCSVNSGKSAVVYRFAGDGATLGAPKLLWSPPVQYCGGSQSASIARMRDPAKPDFVFGTGDKLELRDGATGAVVASMPSFGVAVQASRCTPVNVDADANEELLCVLIDTSGTPNNGRRAYLIDYRLNPDPRLEVVWETLVGTEDGNVRIPASFLGDLDGDGALEFTVSGKNAGGTWSAYVYDAATGIERARKDGATAVGIAPIVAGGGSAWLLDESGTLTAHRLDPNDALSPIFSLPQRGAVSAVDLAAGQTSSLSSRLVTLDLDGDGTRELLTNVDNGAAVELVRVTKDGAALGGKYAPGAGVSVLAAWGATVAGMPTVALAQSDGNFHLLDDAFVPVSGNPSFGARFGGFYASSQFRLLATYPVVGDLGDAVPGVLVVTSRGALQRLDARSASFASPPQVLWSRDRTHGAQIAKGLGPNGQPGIVAVEKRPGASDRVVALAADGTLLWEREIEGVVLADLATGNLDGDSIPDVVVDHGDLGDSLERVTALRGATGEVAWKATPVGPGNRQPAGGALVDWNADGVDDFVFEYQKTRVLDGKTGAVLAESALGGDYFMPIAEDTNGDGKPDLTLYAGYTAPATIAHALDAYLWKGEAEDRPLTYGAMASCPAGKTLLGGSWLVRPRLLRVVAGGLEAGSRSTQVLAGGESYPDLASATLAGVRLGQLGSPAIHENLMGDGRPVAVVGSEDGWIYGVDPCTGELRLRHEIGAPVGAIAFGDTDGDGKDELLASSADGHLYALANESVAAVSQVLDVDPTKGIEDADVDTIESVDTLYGAWSAVSGAERYEVAVVRDAIDGGGFVTSGPWIDAGTATKATLAGLELTAGRRYFVAVRAVRGASRSPDRLSDGVTVLATGGSGAGGSGAGGGSASGSTTGSGTESYDDLVFGRGCGCSFAGREDARLLAPWLLGVTLVVARRTRRTRQLSRGGAACSIEDA